MGGSFLTTGMRDFPSEEMNKHRLALVIWMGSAAWPLGMAAGEQGEIDPFQQLVLPIMEARCTECHGADRVRGKLRLDSYEAMLEGGSEGASVVPGDLAASLMIERIHLPEGDDERMPPDDKEQLEAGHVELLEWWIAGGARAEGKIAMGELPEGLREVAKNVLAGIPRAAGVEDLAEAMLRVPEPSDEQRGEIASLIAEVRDAGVLVLPLASGSPELRFSALNVAGEFGDAELARLAGIGPWVVQADLARTQVSDGGLALLAEMPNLRKLHLENTGIGDAGLVHLAGLKDLEYLNLYGTQVSNAGLAHLAGLEKLRAIYVWQTGVDDGGAAQIKGAIPTLQVVNLGWREEDDAKPRLDLEAAEAILAGVAEAAEGAVVAVAGAKEDVGEARAVLDEAKGAVAGVAAAVDGAAAAAEALAKALEEAEAELGEGGVVEEGSSSTEAGEFVVVASAVEGDEAGVAEAKAFEKLVLPILEAKCNECHSGDNVKGRLRLDEYDKVMAAGASGAPAVVAGEVDESEMMFRIHLPMDDDEHMPPDNREQLDEGEIALLEWWIKGGAKADATVGEIGLPEDLVPVALAVLNNPPQRAVQVVEVEEMLVPEPDEAGQAAIAAAIAEAGQSGLLLMPVAEKTAALRLTALNVARTFGDEDLAKLAPVAPYIVWADLARTQVTDAGLATIGQMSHLRRLHLENTGVTDAGLSHLGGLDKLEYLNLYGTGVSDGGVGALGGLGGLKKLYLWQTGVSAEGAAKLGESLPEAEVNLGLDEAGDGEEEGVPTEEVGAE